MTPLPALRRLAFGLCALVMLAALAFHALMVLGVIAYGHRGQQPTGERVVFWFILTGLGTGLVLAGSAANRARLDLRGVALLSVLAVSVAFVRWFSPDPYYLTTGGSIADGGTMSVRWIVTLLVAAALCLLSAPAGRRRAATGLGAAAVWLSATVVMTDGSNH